MMRKKIRFVTFLLALLLSVAMLPLSALADVTNVRSLGDGSYEISWNDAGATTLITVWKTSDNFDADYEANGFTTASLDSGRSKIVSYYMAPGQSYWFLIRDGSGNISAPYAYNAPSPANFNEFQKPPQLSNFQLRYRTRDGRYENVDYYSYSDLETAGVTNSFGFGWTFTYPTLKKPRHYLWQLVMTDPYGCAYVFDAESFELPAGRSWLQFDYFPIEGYFESLMNIRHEIPVGEYMFSIYWDGVHVCSASFRVR